MNSVAAAKPGSLVAEARRQLGFSQKRFAERVGVSLWTLDRIETGTADVGEHLSRIAAVSGRPERWFVAGAQSPTLTGPGFTATSSRTRLVSRLHRNVMTGRNLLLGSIALLVLVRFFTEVVPVIPRAANFVDVPIFFVLAIVAMAQTNAIPRGMSFSLPVLLFVSLCVLSVSLNIARVEPGPALLFLYGFLAPIGVGAAAYRLWPVGHVLSLSRMLVTLGVVELVVVGAIDLPRFIASGNPDVVSGTFGTNAYQLVFFLLLVMALLAGIFTFEKHRLSARLALPLFAGILTVIFLAQYRALLVTTALTVLFIGLLLGVRGRGIVAGIVVAASFAISLTYVEQNFPRLRFASTLTTLQQDPTLYASKRLKTAEAVINLYTDDPLAIVFGSGPGTFSSRAWQTFANADSTSQSNVQGSYVKALGSTNYRTDVSDRYVLPLTQGPTIGGSRAVTSPFSSYVSLLAEVGLPGFLLIVGMYVAVTTRAIRMAMRAMSDAVTGDPLPACVLACAIGFLLLLQMGFLENWLEVTRITFPTWMLFGVVSKELRARDGAAT